MHIAKLTLYAVYLFQLLLIIGCSSQSDSGSDDNHVREPQAEQLSSVIDTNSVSYTQSRTTGYHNSEIAIMENQSSRPISIIDEIWEAREKDECDRVIQLVDQYITQTTDTNMSGVCLFLKGDCLRRKGNYIDSKNLLKEVISLYPDAHWISEIVVHGEVQQVDISVRPLCELALVLVEKKNQSQFPQTSGQYTTLAWEYLKSEDYSIARKLAFSCIDQYQSFAKEQQQDHIDQYGLDMPKISRDNEEKYWREFWALFDVGTCWYIAGDSYYGEATRFAGDKKADSLNEALRCYDQIINHYPAAQCYDDIGRWYWHVATGASEKKGRVERSLANNNSQKK